MTVKSLDAVCQELEDQMTSQRQNLLSQLEAMRDSGENPEHIECFGFIDMYLTGSLGAKT